MLDIFPPINIPFGFSWVFVFAGAGQYYTAAGRPISSAWGQHGY